jgi:hypothetical protein
LALAHREELLERRLVDKDRLRADRRRAGDAVGETMPVALLGPLGLERDLGAHTSDAEVRALNGKLDARSWVAHEWRSGIGGAECLRKKGGRAVRTVRRAELHDHDEDRRGERGKCHEAEG